MSKSKEITIYFDGACDGNGSDGSSSGCGAVIRRDGHRDIEICRYIGKSTNNECEYTALFLPIRYIVDNNIECDVINVIGDSLLVINQMKKAWKIHKPELRVINKAISIQMNKLKNCRFTFTHVLRNFNEEADLLSKKAKKEKVSPLSMETLKLLGLDKKNGHK